MTKDDITELKGDILDIKRDVTNLQKQFNELRIYFENHWHVDQKVTGQPVFLQELYEQKVKAAQRQQIPQEGVEEEEKKEE
jgi:hypothetical protein